MNSKRLQSGQATRMNSGQAVIVPVTMLILVALSLIARGVQLVKTESELARGLTTSKQAGALADAGGEDVTYRIRLAKQYDTTEYVSLNAFKSTTTVNINPISGVKSVLALGNIERRIRQKLISLVKGDRVVFNYGIQVGNGGFVMANTSSVLGNIYSNGSVTGAGNTVTGAVISAGSTGLIDNIHSTGDAYAHTISNSFVGGDAYYFSVPLLFTTVVGTEYPGSSDKPTTTLPISDTQIAQWETVAAAGGVISSPCPYVITTNTTLGPKKINCDLEISGSPEITLAGMVWVNGNITFKNTPVISIDSVLGSNSMAFIADKTIDHTNSSKIDIQNSTTFEGSGTPGSFIFLISANTGAENPPPGPMGTNIIAVNLQNSANGAVVLYANHGKINIANSSQLRSVTGYRVNMANSAQLIYEDGLESTVFDTGPGGSWNVLDWKETQ